MSFRERRYNFPPSSSRTYQETLVLQQSEGFPDRCAAHAQFRGQLAVRKIGAGLKFPVHDLLLDEAIYLFLKGPDSIGARRGNTRKFL